MDKIRKVLALVSVVLFTLAIVTAVPADARATGTIFVKHMFDGRMVTLDVESIDSIENVKQKVYEKIEIPPEQQILKFADKVLENGRTIADYNIHNDATLLLYLKTEPVVLDNIYRKYQGQDFTISGYSTFEEVIVKVFASDDTSFYVDVLPVTDMQFENTLSIPNDARVGTYKVVVGMGDSIAEDSFLVRAYESDKSISEPVDEENNSVEEEVITVEVIDGNLGDTVTETEIRRKKTAEGKVVDEVTLLKEKTQETVSKLKEHGSDTARIIIPDEKDEVSEVLVNIPQDSVNELATNETNLEITTNGVDISVSKESMKDFEENLYFSIIPVKDEDKKRELEYRASVEVFVKEVVKNKAVKLLGRPMDIKTNMQSRPVQLSMPLTDLPVDELERQELIDNLVVYIEHSDGTKELVEGSIVTKEDGTIQVQFTIDKFSTFTLVYMEGWRKSQNIHEPYMTGYPDGTFRPNKDITRAEMAVILSRLDVFEEASSKVEFVDLVGTHWAMKDIARITNAGLMSGYPNREFKPEQPITRAEVATVIAKWKQSVLTDDMNETTWTDVKGHWAERNLRQLELENWINGYKDGSFKPNAPITRAEAVTLMNRVLNRGPLFGLVNEKWKDVPKDHWSFEQINEATLSHRFEVMNKGEKVILEME